MSKKVYLSPSSQTENAYAWGNTNEAVQCRRIADACEVALKRCGFEVMNNTGADMYARCSDSDRWGADLHVPIHTNAFNRKVTGTRIYCFNTMGEGYKASKAIFSTLAPYTNTEFDVKAYVRPNDLYEITYPNAPTAYIEVDFHDVISVAKWIVENVVGIGEKIAEGICNYFGVKYIPNEPAPTPVTTANVALPILSRGDDNGHVMTAQILLNAYNKAGLTVDGVFGQGTDKAVKAYQKSRKLTADGIIGAKTWAQLLK